MGNSVRNINQQFWRSERIPYLVIRSTHHSDKAYKAHSHAELSIGIIESGQTCLSMGGEPVVLSPRDIVLIEPGKVHACNPIDGQPRSYHMLYVDSGWCCDVLSSLYGYEVGQFVCEQHVLSGTGEKEILAGLVRALLNHQPQDLAAQLERELFHLLSRYCSPHVTSDNADRLACQIRNQLLENLADPPSIRTIAQRLGRPQESIIRHFKRCFGITPKALLHNHRVEKAKRLLKCGMSIVDVATEVGYSDQSQLHRAFVNYTASTPRQYQRVTSISDNNS